MALQLDTSLYQTNPIDLATPVQAGLNAYEQVNRVRNATAARNAAEREAKAKAKEESDYLEHQNKLHTHMNAVKGEVARYVKSFPEERRQEIWDKRARQSLTAAGIDTAEMHDYDPAELEAWDLNSSGENVRSRNQIAEQKDLTTRYNTDQNNATKMLLQQYTAANEKKTIVRGNNGNVWLQSRTDPNDHVDTGLGFDQSRSFLTQDGLGGYSIVNYNPPATQVPPSVPPPTPTQGSQPPYPEVAQPTVVPPPIPQAMPPVSGVTSTPVTDANGKQVTKGKPLPEQVKAHIANAVEQSQTLGDIADQLDQYAKSHPEGGKSLLQKIVKPTGLVAGTIDKMTPLGMGAAINNEINPDSADLRMLLGRLESLELKDLSGKAVNRFEMQKFAKWLPGVGDPNVHSLGPKIRLMKEFFDRQLKISSKQFSPEAGYVQDPLLSNISGYDAGLAAKQAELAAAQARLKALQAAKTTPADTSNISNLSTGKKAPKHLGKVTSLPPGGFTEGDTQDNVDENGKPVVLIFTNGKWQVK